MLRTLLPLLAVVLTATPALAAASDAPARAPMPAEVWKDYTYDGDGFGISSPVEPVFTHQTKPTPNGTAARNSYEVNLAVGTLDLSVSLLPPGDKRTPDQVFTETKTMAANGMRAHVTNFTPVIGVPFQCVQYELTAPQLHGRMRYCLIGHKLFQLGAIAPTGQPLPSEADKWFSSFHTLDKK